MATKLPSGQYRSQVYIGTDNGKRVYKSFVAETSKAADLAALQYKAERGHSRSAKTFGKAAEEYVLTVSHTMSPTTLRWYGSVDRTLKKDYQRFYNTPLSSIDGQDLQRLIYQIAAIRTPKTVRNYHSFISSVMRHNGLQIPSVSLPKRKIPDLNIPDEEVLKKLFESVKDTDMEIPVLLGALVPMREGEICAADISDLNGNVLHIHRSMARADHGKIIMKQPKTDASDRYVELPEKLADKIREQGYICNIPFKQFSKHFARTLKKTGLDHFRFHDLRHAFVSIAHAAGIPDAYIMARGGWSTNYTMNNVYRHVLDSNRKEMEETVNKKFSSLL